MPWFTREQLKKRLMDKNMFQHGNCDHMTISKLEAMIETYPKRIVKECGCSEEVCECVSFGMYEDNRVYYEYFVEPKSYTTTTTDQELYRYVIGILESIQAHHNTNNTVQYDFTIRQPCNDPTVDVQIHLVTNASAEYLHAYADVMRDGKFAFSGFVAPGQKVLCPVYKH